MKINGTDISIYGASQWNVTPELSSLTNASQWIAGALSPLLLPARAGMKKMKVSVMIKGNSRGEIWENARKLVARLLAPSEIELDGFPNKFRMVLTNAGSAELSLQNFHKATLELAGYEHGEEETVHKTSYTTIYVYNPGNVETPTVVEVTPLIGKTSLEIRGIVRDRYQGEDKPVTIKKLAQSLPIILDGEKGLITAAGTNRISDVDTWGLPSLKPGENLIQLDQPDMDIKIRYKPRYL